MPVDEWSNLYMWLGERSLANSDQLPSEALATGGLIELRCRKYYGVSQHTVPDWLSLSQYTTLWLSGLHPKWHPIPYIVHYVVYQGPYEGT
jgi:hypothetical protein